MMKLPLLVCVAVAVCSVTAAQTADDRVPFADPYILYYDGVYYAYGTHRSDGGIGVATSTDLRTWDFWVGKAKDGYALAKGDAFGASGFWAPEVYRRGDRFVMYYTAQFRVCAAVSKSPLGPFVNETPEPIIAGLRAIDNSLFVDKDGSLKMVFARLEGGSNIAWMTDMQPDALRERYGNRRFLLKAELPWELYSGKITEGPFLIVHDGVYYLTYSSNEYPDKRYSIGLATATAVTGPWKKRTAGPIACQLGGLNGTGHHSFFRDADGRWRIVFHAHSSESEVNPRHMYIADVKFVRDAQNEPTIEIGGEIITCRLRPDERKVGADR